MGSVFVIFYTKMPTFWSQNLNVATQWDRIFEMEIIKYADYFIAKSRYPTKPSSDLNKW